MKTYLKRIIAASLLCFSSVDSSATVLEMVSTDNATFQEHVAVPKKLNVFFTTTDGANLSIGVPIDGQKHVISTLTCYNEDTSQYISKCSSAVVDYIKPFLPQDEYCCQIGWHDRTDTSDIVNGGQTISPPQAMVNIQCQHLKDGVCPAWPISNSAFRAPIEDWRDVLSTVVLWLLTTMLW